MLKNIRNIFANHQPLLRLQNTAGHKYDLSKQLYNNVQTLFNNIKKRIINNRLLENYSMICKKTRQHNFSTFGQKLINHFSKKIPQ